MKNDLHSNDKIIIEMNPVIIIASYTIGIFLIGPLYILTFNLLWILVTGVFSMVLWTIVEHDSMIDRIIAHYGIFSLIFLIRIPLTFFLLIVIFFFSWWKYTTKQSRQSLI